MPSSTFVSLQWLAIYMPSMLPSLEGRQAFLYEQTPNITPPDHPSKQVSFRIQSAALTEHDNTPFLTVKTAISVNGSWLMDATRDSEIDCLGSSLFWPQYAFRREINKAPCFVPNIDWTVLARLSQAIWKETLFHQARPSQLFVEIPLEDLRALNLVANLTFQAQTYHIPLTDYPVVIPLCADTYLCYKGYSAMSPSSLVSKHSEITLELGWSIVPQCMPQVPNTPWQLDATECIELLMAIVNSQPLRGMLQQIADTILGPFEENTTQLNSLKFYSSVDDGPSYYAETILHMEHLNGGVSLLLLETEQIEWNTLPVLHFRVLDHSHGIKKDISLPWNEHPLDPLITWLTHIVVHQTSC